MTLQETLIELWRQVMVDGRTQGEIAGARYRVGATRAAGLRTVGFTYGGRLLEGIEQNPNTRSRWAKLAQEGKQVMQFTSSHRYVANVCDGALTRYPAWKALDLPE